MKHIKGRIIFINEDINEADPYGEERWEENNNFRSFNEGDDFEAWLVEIGVPDEDIQELYLRMDYYMDIVKKKKKGVPGMAAKGAEYLFAEIMPFIQLIGYNLNLPDEDMDNFVGACILGNNKFKND